MPDTIHIVADYKAGRLTQHGTGREGYRWSVPVSKGDIKEFVVIHEDGDGGCYRIAASDFKNARQFEQDIMEWAKSLYPGKIITEPISAWVSMNCLGEGQEAAFQYLVSNPPKPSRKPRYDITLYAKARMKGHYSLDAGSVEEVKEKMADLTGDVHWHYQELDEDSGVYADIGGPALYGEESHFEVPIIEEPAPAEIGSSYVTTVTVVDPDTNGTVDIEIRKLNTGAMVGIDGSYLANDVGPTHSPYDPNYRIVIPDDEH